MKALYGAQPPHPSISKRRRAEFVRSSTATVSAVHAEDEREPSSNGPPEEIHTHTHTPGEHNGRGGPTIVFHALVGFFIIYGRPFESRSVDDRPLPPPPLSIIKRTNAPVFLFNRY